MDWVRLESVDIGYIETLLYIHINTHNTNTAHIIPLYTPIHPHTPTVSSISSLAINCSYVCQLMVIFWKEGGVAR